MQQANFFWHGQMTQYELFCIESFVHHGFDVNVWSYTPLSSLRFNDAREILDISHLRKYSQGNKKANIAAFSDVFRFNLLHQRGGWWFDADCICLKDVNEFELLMHDKKIVAGYEDRNRIGSAVLWFDDKQTSSLFLNELQQRCETNKNTFKAWGHIGPIMVTDVVKKHDLTSDICTPNYFYPVHYHKFSLFFESTKIHEVEKLCSNSYTCHLWDSLFRKYRINKKIIPKGSWLHKMYSLTFNM
jgi:hypothetical protein